jgi:hypothetical protein
MPLSAEEVEQLRRLNVLSQFGELPAPIQALFDELLSRDTGEMLAPTVDVQVIPQQRGSDDVVDDLDESVRIRSR